MKLAAPPLSRRAALAALGSALGTSALGCSRKRDLTGEIVVGHLNNLTHAQILTGSTSGLFRGVRTMAFPAGPAVMEALSAGSIDAGFVGASAAINAYVRSAGRKLTVLSGAASGGASLVVRRNSGIRTAADLVGRVATASQIGSMPDIALRSFLLENGQSPKDRGGKVAIVPMPNAEAFELMKRGSLDAFWAQEPWASRLCDKHADRLIDERSLWEGGMFPSVLLVASRRLVREAPRRAEELTDQLARETARLREQPDGGRAEAANAVARALGKALPSAVLEDAWSRFTLTTDALPRAADRIAQRMRRLGYLPEGTLDGFHEIAVRG